ncbi:uncharacterized protein VICG_00471 [Vittaforma corneae ATCC 50505]|uniref:Clathrin/coatomer adaptor adaptin-like N-terminal domain-containing protein n=1 Tax=Vittaforma corneae (strain ATCC 50505) TaxID=993615 RepID=L2GN96_VITCO|nr:uncharacterized protein VICG_00471 [Vittaforma corneae ATCC 50505]ELA42373.1 hypothetical protein VICG_00471 [Vittaforma corneae ATCC 50505]
MCSHRREEVRMHTARCLSIFYLKNRKLFYEKDLLKYLKILLQDQKEGVVVSALKALVVIECRESAISIQDVLMIAQGFWERGCNDGLRSALNILKYKEVNEAAKSLLLKTLRATT